MTGKIETVQAYRDSKGEVHNTRQEAIDSQIDINLQQWADDVGLCSGGEWSQDMVLNELWHHREQLAKILSGEGVDV